VDHGELEVSIRVIHRDAARLRDEHQRERGEGEHLRGGKKAPVLPNGGAGDLSEAGGTGADGDGEDGQHHGRFGQCRDGHLTAAAEAAEGAAGIESAERQKEAAQPEQIDHSQHAAEQAERRFGGDHGNHQAR
jgi:hypothetical protein